ncbi:DapH/DapD/GlmU-related protein [Rhizobium ruizarguesonis]|uniref:acyltransferase n=1 Tax=Rhizobium ruizarguesonis TaxID=2081791 RepID=UPI0010326396|nr:acyltransferase [Rhizobium ruizarguesonis]TAY92208.1 acyltransferase [Rhizobium ruizarguesonis]TBA41315.1 acyltransferase [Rhizobium ruizarguesonis]
MRPHWDHAFASGGVYQEPDNWSKLLDPVFRVGERLYGQYSMRRIWAAWKKAALLEPGVRLGGNARLINKHTRDAARIGENTVCRGIIRVERGARVDIGKGVYLGDEAIISAMESVTIGRGTLIAHGVQIFDNTSHPIDWRGRERHFKRILGQRVDGSIEIPTAPVSIGEHCWLGFGSAVLKGVTIGDRSIVAAGCVVTKDVPPDTLVVSSMATFIDLNKQG